MTSTESPWAPPATRATILNPPKSRNSWDQRVIDAWHIGPAWDHYMALKFYISSTGGTSISDNYQLYLKHCDIPKETRMDEAVRVAKISSVQYRRYKAKKHNNQEGMQQHWQNWQKSFR